MWQAILDHITGATSSVDPEIGITAGGGITEGGDASFTVSANPTPSATLSVSVSVTQLGDFGVTTGSRTVSIPTTGSATLTVSTADDGVDEADGSVKATLATGSGYTVSTTQGAASVVVSDDDDPPQQQQPQEFVPDANLVAALQTKIDGHPNEEAKTRLTKILDGINGEQGGYSATQCRDVASTWGVSADWKDWCDEIERREDFVPQTPSDPEISISANGDIREGGDATFTVSANPAPSANLSVSVSVTQDGDFGVTTGTHTVNIPTIGSATLTVSTTDDAVEETDGSVTATLVAGADYAVSATQGVATVAVADDDGAVFDGSLGDAFVESLQDAIEQTEAVQLSAQSVDMAVQQSDQQQGVPQQTPPFTGTSVVYVVDDSGSMDGDWPEVRTALEAVRDMSGVTDTKVALISFGFLHPTVLFGLTDHASAPWDTPLNRGYTGKKEYLNGLTPIEAFGGYKGGTAYTDPLKNALQLFNATPGATIRKIVFMSGAQAARSDRYPTDVITEISAAGIVIDTVYFGDHYAFLNSDLQKMPTDTGGSHTNVLKPSTGTTNDLAVTARALPDILAEKAVANTTTLYLVDTSFSLMPRTEDGTVMKGHILRALDAVETKVQGTATARAGVARFLGRNEIADFDYQIEVDGVIETRTYDEDDRYEEPYALEVAFNTGSAFDATTDEFWMAQTGSTELDQALDMAHASISAESGTTRRVVLITDGITTSKPSAATLAKYTADGIILDVVAFGAHADRVYLKSIADTNSSWTFSVAETPTVDGD